MTITPAASSMPITPSDPRLLALLVMGVAANAERLVAAAEAHAPARTAAERLSSTDSAATGSQRPGVSDLAELIQQSASALGRDVPLKTGAEIGGKD
ncbi:hypothetical protein [Streptomyces sp. RG80]|uniref:hypothetical protein n=1 Tax=Streptomyces sp. RG80 TaxID=3157340 RepID=UPI00338DC5AD